MTTENGVYLLIGNELRQVKDYNNEPDAKVAVVYQGTVVIIPPKNFGEADYHNAMKIVEANGEKLGNNPDWVIVDSQLKEANEALELLGHDIINRAYWTSAESISGFAWYYYSGGYLDNISKYGSLIVRSLSSFPLDALKTK